MPVDDAALRGSAVLSRVLPTERLLFAGDLTCAGTFACDVDDPSFGGGQPSTAHCIVFSRTPVWIQHDAGVRYVADATRVTLHNRGCAYRRWKIDPRGDRCDWIAYAEDVAAAVTGRWDPARIDSDSSTPFRFQSAAATSSIYLRQRRLFERLAVGAADALLIEEEALALLHAVSARLYADTTPPSHYATREHHREFDAIQDVREQIAATPAQPHALRSLGAAVGLSP